MDLKSYPVLYVDDDNANRIVIKHNLGHEFALLLADSGPAALEILAEQPVAVLLADQRMPGMTGVDLAQRVLELYPEVVRVIITAYSDLEATVDAINRAHVNRFIKKPWTREELVAVMRESVSAYQQSQLIKQLRERLTQLDRAAAIGIMSSSIAHDLRQPLACITPSVAALKKEMASLLETTVSPRYAQDRLHSMQEVVDRLASGVSNLSRVSSTLLESLRSARSPTRRLDLRRVVESALTITRSTLITGARLEVELPDEPLEIEGSEGRLLQLLVNLLLNAAQAIAPGAPLRNRIGIRVVGTAERIILSVDDTGCGIPPENMAKLFTPFFTTKGSAGTGLGLAICRQVVEEMGGTIHVESKPEEGTRFVASFPRAG